MRKIEKKSTQLKKLIQNQNLEYGLEKEDSTDCFCIFASRYRWLFELKLDLREETVEDRMSEGKLSGCLSNFEELGATNQDIEQMKNIDNLLKCGICYEYFSTCVITDCSHNFCSLCIRKYIQYKTECPVCFQQLYDSQLRANRIIDNLVTIFPDLKDRIVRHLRTLRTLKPNCIYVSPTKKDDTTPKTPNARSRTPKTPTIQPGENAGEKESRTPAIASSSQLTNQAVESSKVIIPKIFQSPVKKKTSHVENVIHKHVSCPVCSVDILERNINAHLDDCLNRDKDEKRKTSKQYPKRKHLPKLVYRLMSINVLRAKVKEYGLNAHGDFETLKNRLQKYTALYNAECDKTDPRPVQELIRQLEKEEKALSSQKLPKNIFNVSRDDVSKEELNQQYLKENKDSFQNLVRSVKRREEPLATNENSSREPESKENISVFHCEPSTSKSSFNEFCDNRQDTKDWIEIEEHDVKIEPVVEIKEENSDEKSVSDHEKIKEQNEEDDDDVASFLLRNHRRKSKRNLFQTTTYNNLDSEEDEEVLIGPRKNSESEEEIHSNYSDDTDFEDCSNSPVIKKGNTRKRSKTEVSGKSFRKRKK